MPILEVEAGGRITLTREFLTHLGIAPGERVEVTRRPDGELEFSAAGRGQAGSERPELPDELSRDAQRD